MRALHVLALLVVAPTPAAVAQLGAAQVARQPLRGGEPVVPGRVLLRTVAGADADGLVEVLGLTLGPDHLGLDTHVVVVPPGQEPALAAALAAQPEVVWAEPDRLLAAPEMPACGAAPTPSTQQCTIAIFDGDPAPERYFDQPTVPIIQAAAAQALSAGLPSVVAVIDTGVDPTHPVLDGRLASAGHDYVLDRPGGWDLADGVDDDHDGLVDEAWGHGTHVAGIVALINPSALVLPLRVLDSDGNGSAFDVAAAIHRAVDEGADVINLSLGMTAFSRVVEDALERADDAEVQVFAAAGNTGSSIVHYPARSGAAVAVTALGDDDVKADFAAYGDAVELCAPGVAIYSAMPGGAWAWWSGTSMATAVASGAASLLHSVTPPTDEPGAADALEETCADIEAVNPAHHEALGEGRIDVEAGALHLIGSSGSD